MSQDLANTNVLILVFAMPGCPACHDYLPRLTKQVQGFQKLGHPFVIYQNGVALMPQAIPIVVLDSTTKDPEVQALCEQHGIMNLPTTVLLPRIGYPAKYEGSLDDQQVYALLNAALATNS
jgi:hypothetical protein